MNPTANPTLSLLAGPRQLNLYFLHELFGDIARRISEHLRLEQGWDIPLTAGIWGGSYLVANNYGVSRSNVVRLYSIVNVPQNTPLDTPENFQKLIDLYRETFQSRFKTYGLDLVDPHWGEKVPYTNQVFPTTTLQLWDATGRVKFVRAFFVRNHATWAESIIYDTVRNVKQIKELLDIDHRPQKKPPDELKFMLQDVLIIYYTLKNALTADFKEHAEPTIRELLDNFLKGLHDPELIVELYHKVYSNALVYGYEEILEPAYRQDGLDIHRIEEWPVEKINWVPESLKRILVPYLEGTFQRFRENLENLPPNAQIPIN